MEMPLQTRRLIRQALTEDIGDGDVTTGATIPPDSESRAELVAKASFVVAGLPFAAEVFRALDRGVSFEPLVEEGRKVSKSAVLARLSGKTASLLRGERVALNILQRLSGIATLSAKFASRVEGLRCQVLDTRKTTPGMRFMEKYAVRAGGCSNHRMGLYDGILIKDNHIRAAGGIKKAVRLARRAARRGMKVEVEAAALDDVREALEAGADVIMLDNMTLEEMKRAVRMARGKAALEASGNVTLRNVRQIAETGVDYVSVGALTHSAPAADISMRFSQT
jgi:nicotinate-nucleotide pyrophosphorylase (carboxylating)